MEEIEIYILMQRQIVTFAEGGICLVEENLTYECGQIRYLMNKQVVLKKLYLQVGLVKICYINEDTTFIVDINAISNSPDLTKTLSLSLLGG